MLRYTQLIDNSALLDVYWLLSVKFNNQYKLGYLKDYESVSSIIYIIHYNDKRCSQSRKTIWRVSFIAPNIHIIIS